MFFFDINYFLFILPALALAMWAQNHVNGSFRHYAGVRVRRGVSAAEVARGILDQARLEDVPVERVPGRLTDHYDPRSRRIRLSDAVYDSRSIAAVGVAAHEAGHAIQHDQAYFWLAVRNSIIPVTQFASQAAFPLFFIGLFLSSTPLGLSLMDLGILFFLGAVIVQLVTLPVELDASNRAVALLEAGGYLEKDELPGARRVLSAAAWTYVAAALMAVMQLLYLLALRGRRS